MSTGEQRMEVGTFAIPTEDKVRYKRMFDTLDTDNNGKIDLCGICGALQRAYITHGYEINIDIFYEMANKTPGSSLTFREFVILMSKIEDDLKIMFMKFDKASDKETIDLKDIQAFFQLYNVDLSDEKAKELIETLAKDDQTTIAWDEWTKFHVFQYFTPAEDMVVFWRQFTTVDKKDQGAWWKILTAGGVAGVISKTITAPIERIRICYQVHGNMYGVMGLSGTVRSMVKQGGVASLWRSNGVSLVKLLPDSAIRFFAYEKLKDLASDGQQDYLPVQHKIAIGSLSGALSQTIIYPLEVVKVRYAISSSKQYKGVIDCIKKNYKRKGFWSFYRGYSTSMAGIVPYAGVDLATYETLTLSYKSRHPDKEHPGTFAIFTFGSLSSLISQTVSYPLSLLRSKLQAGIGGRNSYEVCRNIYMTEGIRGFYRGLLPCLMKVVPAGSISYVVYEEIKLALSLV